MSAESPWLNLKEAAVYARRAPRFLARQIRDGRLRAARVGGRGEFCLRREWIDEWLEGLSRPIHVSFGRIAR